MQIKFRIESSKETSFKVHKKKKKAEKIENVYRRLKKTLLKTKHFHSIRINKSLFTTFLL